MAPPLGARVKPSVTREFAVVGVFAPRETGAAAGAGGIFPLGLGWQAEAADAAGVEPGDKGLGVGPGNALDGMRRRGGEILKRGRIFLRDRAPLGLGDFKFSEPERARDRDLVRRAFVAHAADLRLRAAHRELARRDFHECERGALGERDHPLGRRGGDGGGQTEGEAKNRE
jgi:hypothetical protein